MKDNIRIKKFDYEDRPGDKYLIDPIELKLFLTILKDIDINSKEHIQIENIIENTMPRKADYKYKHTDNSIIFVKEIGKYYINNTNKNKLNKVHCLFGFNNILHILTPNIINEIKDINFSDYKNIDNLIKRIKKQDKEIKEFDKNDIKNMNYNNKLTEQSINYLQTQLSKEELNDLKEFYKLNEDEKHKLGLEDDGYVAINNYYISKDDYEDYDAYNVENINDLIKKINLTPKQFDLLKAILNESGLLEDIKNTCDNGKIFYNDTLELIQKKFLEYNAINITENKDGQIKNIGYEWRDGAYIDKDTIFKIINIIREHKIFTTKDTKEKIFNVELERYALMKGMTLEQINKYEAVHNQYKDISIGEIGIIIRTNEVEKETEKLKPQMP